MHTSRWTPCEGGRELLMDTNRVHSWCWCVFFFFLFLLPAVHNNAQCTELVHAGVWQTRDKHTTRRSAESTPRSGSSVFIVSSGRTRPREKHGTGVMWTTVGKSKEHHLPRPGSLPTARRRRLVWPCCCCGSLSPGRSDKYKLTGAIGKPFKGSFPCSYTLMDLFSS